MKRCFCICVLAVVVLLSSCNIGEEESDVDFRSHPPATRSVIVSNDTGERLVVFMGELRIDRLVGGIPAHAQMHGLPKPAGLFNASQAVPLIVLTYEQFNANRDNLLSQNLTPFTRLFVFYNEFGDNLVVNRISQNVGGQNILRLINVSQSVNVELRYGGVAGPTLGFAPAGMLNTDLRLYDGDFNVFPVFHRWDAVRDIFQTVYPEFTSGELAGTAYFYQFSMTGSDEIHMDLSKLLQGQRFVSGAAMVIVQNNSDSMGIQFMEGAVPRRTPSGFLNISQGVNNGMHFIIDMPSVQGTSNYAPSVTVDNWRFGVAATSFLLPSTTLLADHFYVITVTGSVEAGFHAAIDEGTPMTDNVFDW